MCGSVRVGVKNTQNVSWYNEAKVAVESKEATWKEVLGARDESAKERCMEVYKEE